VQKLELCGIPLYKEQVDKILSCKILTDFSFETSFKPDIDIHNGDLGSSNAFS
jgi:hypothetical protein